MTGLFRIALKILASDRGKFTTLIVGITIAVFLMMQITAIFSSVLYRLASNIINVGGTVWMMDPSVNIQENRIPMPTYVLDLAKSIKGVKYAAPLVITEMLLKLKSGHYQNVELIGIDDASLLGEPDITRGDINMIYAPDAYIGINNSEFHKLDKPDLGMRFGINNRAGMIVAIGKKPVVGLWGMPTLYTTYSQAALFMPAHATLSYIIIEPKSSADIPYIKQRIKELGYAGYTRQEFIDKNTNYYLFNTGFGTNLWIMEVVCFAIGLSIAGQTFYMFVLENTSQFGALKAIGAKKRELISVILFQSILVGILGYGFGALMSSLFMVFAKWKLPNYTALITYTSLSISLCMVLIIIIFTSIIGIRKVTQIEPYNIFRN